MAGSHAPVIIEFPDELPEEIAPEWMLYMENYDGWDMSVE